MGKPGTDGTDPIIIPKKWGTSRLSPVPPPSFPQFFSGATENESGSKVLNVV